MSSLVQQEESYPDVVRKLERAEYATWKSLQGVEARMVNLKGIALAEARRKARVLKASLKKAQDRIFRVHTEHIDECLLAL